jgi:hypothetical protein
MAQIIQRIFSDGPNQGIILSPSILSYTASANSSITRQLSFGSNWTVLRMGITCGIGDASTQSYGRNCGLSMGFSSGSHTYYQDRNTRTFLGMNAESHMFPKWGNTYAMSYVNDTISGSFFALADATLVGYTLGVYNVPHSTTFTSYGYFMIANEGDPKQRKSLLILEVSYSADAVSTVTKLYGMVSQSAINLDYTSGSLLAALTSSQVGTLSASGIGMGYMATGGINFNKSTYPLDTAFIEWSGGMPFEIYDWYIFKVQ